MKNTLTEMTLKEAWIWSKGANLLRTTRKKCSTQNQKEIKKKEAITVVCASKTYDDAE